MSALAALRTRVRRGGRGLLLTCSSSGPGGVAQELWSPGRALRACGPAVARPRGVQLSWKASSASPGSGPLMKPSTSTSAGGQAVAVAARVADALPGCKACSLACCAESCSMLGSPAGESPLGVVAAGVRQVMLRGLARTRPAWPCSCAAGPPLGPASSWVSPRRQRTLLHHRLPSQCVQQSARKPTGAASRP